MSFFLLIVSTNVLKQKTKKSISILLLCCITRQTITIKDIKRRVIDLSEKKKMKVCDHHHLTTLIFLVRTMKINHIQQAENDGKDSHF